MNKKLELKKQTIANLTRKEQSEVKAGAYKACWENLLTWYHCDVVWTGNKDETEDTVAVQQLNVAGNNNRNRNRRGNGHN